MNNIEVKIVAKSEEFIPTYTTDGAAGADVRACINEPINIAPGERVLVPTGISVAIPEGYEMQVRPRSGLALKNGISIVNSPGTVDSDYRGEVGVILINQGYDVFTINPGDRVAQVVFNEVPRAKFVSVTNLNETERNSGGFGHSGVK